MRDDRFYSKVVFWTGFLFVAVCGLLVQTVLLPQFFPNHCSEVGLLLGGDADVCHQIALREVCRINEEGLTSWTLVPGVDKLLLSGILSLLYVLTGIHSPLLFLPITALCHGLSALLLFKMMRMFKLPQLASLVGAVLFVILPASFMWTLQPLKESLYIVAIFIYCFAVCKAFLSKGTVRDLVWVVLSCVFGILLIWIIRPFIVSVFCVGLVFCSAILIVPTVRLRKRVLLSSVFLFVGVAGFFLPQFYSGGAMGREIQADYSYQAGSLQLPVAVSRQLKAIAFIRSHFLDFNEGATLEMDSCVRFSSDMDVLRYIPRALTVGLFPSIGVGSFSGSVLFFAAHSLLYLSCLAIFCVWLFKQRGVWLVFFPLGLVMGFELVLRGMTAPNVGTLWRYLYAFKSLVIAFGVAVAVVWLKAGFDAYRNHRHAKVLNETAIVVLGKVLAITGSLFGVRMMTEFLPQEIYGELTLFLSVILVSQYVFGAALEQTAMRYYSIAIQKQAGRLYLKKLLEWFAVSSVLLCVLIVLLRSFLIPSLSPPLLLCIIVFAIAGVGVNLGCGIQSAARNRLLVSGLQAAFEWLRYLLAVACILFFSVSISSVLLGFVFASVFVLIAYAVLITKLPIFKKSAVEQKETLFSNRYFWVMSLSGFFIWIQVFSDRWCIARFLTPSDVGIYQALYQISFSPSLIGSAMLLTIIAPILFHHSKDGQNVLEMSAVLKNYNKVILFLLLTCLGVFALAWMLRDVVPTVLLGKEYRDVSQYFPWMVLSGVLFMLSQQIMLSLCAGMRMGAVLMIRAVTAIVAIVCYGAGTALWGIIGVVYGGICLAFISVGINVAFYAALKRSCRLGVEGE